MLYLGGLSMIKINAFLFLALFFLISFANAETTFFDQDDFFIMGASSEQNSSGSSGKSLGDGGSKNGWLNELLDSYEEGTLTEKNASEKDDIAGDKRPDYSPEDTPSEKNASEKDDIAGYKTSDYLPEETTNDWKHFLIFLIILFFACCFIFFLWVLVYFFQKQGKN